MMMSNAQAGKPMKRGKLMSSEEFCEDGSEFEVSSDERASRREGLS